MAAPAKDEEDEDAPAETPALPWTRVTRFVVKASLRHPFLLSAAVLASFGVAATEILSLGLILPFLSSLGGPALALPPGFPLAFLVPYFEGMDLVSKVRTIALLLLAITLARGALSYVESRVTSYMKILVERDLRQQAFDQLMTVDLGYLQRQKSANLLAILHTYTRHAAIIVDTYLGAFSKTVSFATYLVALLATSWSLTLVALALGLISFLAVGRLNALIKTLSRRTMESRVRVQQVSLESLQGMRVIRSFGREREARERFMDEVRTMQRQSFRRASLTALAPPLHTTLNMALFAGLIVAATFVLDPTEGSWLVMLMLFIVIMGRLMGPLQSFTRKRAKMLEDYPALEALVAFLDSDKPTLKDGTRRFEGLREGLRFEGVSFAYASSPEPVLRGVRIEVRRGQKVALVGPSGSGKSTLLTLLSRLADPTAGRIVVDGTDLRDLQMTTWRRRLAVVSQETFLFHDTVRTNILFGRPEATPVEVEAAARKANAHEFILGMEKGYDTIVGDRGVRLSGGQAQRIAIARAILADPDVLVLDEATSALDAGTERAVQQAIDAASQHRTVIAVAHRLATVRDADVIYVLDKGRVVQRGTHDELVSREGPYRDSVAMQDLGLEPVTRVPVQDGALRVLIDPTARRARVVNGSLVAEGVPLVTARDATDARARADAAEGDVIVVSARDATAYARVGGVFHADVPLYCSDADGREIRVRVRTIR